MIPPSRQPFLDGARALLARGCDPKARLVMRRARSDIDALRSTVAQAAKWVIEEGNRDAPRFRRWKAFHSQDGSSLIAAIDEGLLEGAHG